MRNKIEDNKIILREWKDRYIIYFRNLIIRKDKEIKLSKNKDFKILNELKNKTAFEKR